MDWHRVSRGLGKRDKYGSVILSLEESGKSVNPSFVSVPQTSFPLLLPPHMSSLLPTDKTKQADYASLFCSSSALTFVAVVAVLLLVVVVDNVPQRVA